ncbi:hypothetical protein [Streptomyces sp. NPDC002564]|uniref:hypothetical protein n=1 Tax=Streptomyces sp. NPDC002564 TaxID=3364649 RepID=UPI0036A7FA8B
MTVSSRQVRYGYRGRRDRVRRFDLRATSFLFVLVAILLCAAVFLVRIAAHIVESRPVWIGSLLAVGLAAAYPCRSRWRSFSAAKYARRAAEVLEEAAERASESLEAATAGAPAGAADPRGGSGSVAAAVPGAGPDGTVAVTRRFAPGPAPDEEETVPFVQDMPVGRDEWGADLTRRP